MQLSAIRHARCLLCSQWMVWNPHVTSYRRSRPSPLRNPTGAQLLLRQQLLHSLLGSLEILGQEICLLPRGLGFLLVAAFFQRPRQQ